MKLGEAMYKAQQGEAGGDADATSADTASSDDVVDAEFEEVDGSSPGASPGGDDKKSA